MAGRPDKKSKIICTIGPGSLNLETIKKMYEAGMDAVRINTAHGDFPQYDQIISMTRAAGEIPIMLDLTGPRVRLAIESPREVKVGDVIVGGSSEGELGFSYDFYDDVQVGDRILIDNGVVRTRLEKKEGAKLYLRVLHGGPIENNKGVNIPGKRLNVPQLSPKDLKVIEYSKDKDAEFILLPYARDASDVQGLADEIGSGSQAIIAKIENEEGVRNASEVLEAADGLLVARGDLGVEIDYEKVPFAQKDLIRKCNQRGKIVITATQMLQSMVNNPLPSRAETSDVANAILDGSDALMLSEETSIGSYPVQCVETMARIAKEAEAMVTGKVSIQGFYNISETVSKSIDVIAGSMPLDKIITLTRSGYTARMIARFRPKQPIIAVTDNRMVKRQVELVHGVTPVYVRYREAADLILNACQVLAAKGLVEDDENVLFTAGVRTVKRHQSNLIEIHKVGDLLKVAKTQRTPSLDGKEGQ